MDCKYCTDVMALVSGIMDNADRYDKSTVRLAKKVYRVLEDF